MYLVTCIMQPTPTEIERLPGECLASLEKRAEKAAETHARYVPCDDLPTADAEANNMLSEGGVSVQVWLLYRSATVETKTVWTDHTRGMG